MDGNGYFGRLRIQSGEYDGGRQYYACDSDSEQQYPYLCGYYASTVLAYGARRYLRLDWPGRV